MTTPTFFLLYAVLAGTLVVLWTVIVAALLGRTTTRTTARPAAANPGWNAAIDKINVERIAEAGRTGLPAVLLPRW